jgi:hypothetical protein
LTLISNKAIVIFSVLLSKDLQTGAVGNGRLFPHFFWERIRKKCDISRKKSSAVKREKGRRLDIQRENSRGNSSERAIDCKIIEILRFFS